MDIEKTTQYVKDLVAKAEPFKRFHVRVEAFHLDGVIEATVYSESKETIYAKVVVEDTTFAGHEDQPRHLVRVAIPGFNGSATELRHTILAAANAACDLAQTVNLHLSRAAIPASETYVQPHL